MTELLEYLRFADGFHMWGAVCRMVLAVLCGGIIGLEREYKRRPAGFRTQILICCFTGEVLLRTFLRQFGHFLFHLKIT